MNKLKQFFDITMLKFILVGIVNTAVGMGVMFSFQLLDFFSLQLYCWQYCELFFE